MTARRTRIEQLRQALTEVQANKHVFTPEAFSQIILALLDKTRSLQTLPNHNYRTNNDEVRLVTVMFIDIKDSTELARGMGAEDWKQVLDTAHRQLAEVVAQADGEIGQYLGDGMLCFFGAHQSRGDDAVRAVSSALEAQRIIQEYSAELSDLYDIEMTIRIGISTGRVVVGMIGGAEKQEFLALGPATNLAARLQGACPPGGVLVDAVTYYRTRNNFIAQAQPPAELKGFEELIEYYAIVGYREREATQLARTHIAGLEIPFVGRERELALFSHLLETAHNHQRFHAITVYGAIGLGKSRLLQEFIARTTGQPLTQLAMVATYEQRTTPYNLLRSLLMMSCDLSADMQTEEAQARIEQFFRETCADDEEASAAAAVAGYLTGFGFQDSPHTRPLQRGGPGQERMGFVTLERWFEHLAQSSALLLAVDNLQWADDASLDLLNHLAQTLARYPVLLVAVSRLGFREDKPHYMAELASYSELTLEPLTEDLTLALINAILRYVDHIPETLGTLINERAEGNPLFVEEFLDMLFDSQVFEQTGAQRWKFNRIRYDLTITRLPSGLLDVLQARLDDMAPRARYIAQVAAVVGQTFWPGIVEYLLEGEDVEFYLDALLARGIIVRSAESSFADQEQYHFRHTLYREVAYNMLTRSTRENFHRRAAEWLQSRVWDRPEYLGMLAGHYVQGELFEQALSTYMAAINERLVRGLHDETLKMIETGLAIARNVPREVALPVVSRMWVAQARTLNMLNRFEEASAASMSAQRLFGELPADELLEERVMAARMLGSAYRNLGRYTDAQEVLEAAYEMLPDNPPPAQHVAILRSFGSLSYAQGDLNRSLEFYQRAFDMAQEIGDELQTPSILTQFGLIALDRGDLALALSYFERVLAVNRRREHIFYQISDLRNIGMVYRSLFAYEMALEALDEADTLQSYLHYSDPPGQAYRALCWIALGRSEEGMALLRKCAAEERQSVFSQQVVQLALINGMALTGDYAGCLDAADRFLEQVRGQNPVMVARGTLWRAMAAHAMGDPEAVAQLHEALRMELEYGGRDSWLCYHFLGMTSPDQTTSRGYYEKAAEILNAMSASLDARPNLQIMLMNNDLVQTIFASTSDV